MNEISVIGICQQVAMINETAIRSHMIEAQHVLLCIVQLELDAIDLFCCGRCAKKATKRKTLKVFN